MNEKKSYEYTKKSSLGSYEAKSLIRFFYDSVDGWMDGWMNLGV